MGNLNVGSNYNAPINIANIDNNAANGEELSIDSNWTFNVVGSTFPAVIGNTGTIRYSVSDAPNNQFNEAVVQIQRLANNNFEAFDISYRKNGAEVAFITETNGAPLDVGNQTHFLQAKNLFVHNTGNDGITGSVLNDTLRGNAGVDNINGRDGNDLIFGGSGGDNLNGANGDDEIHGDSGNDNINGGLGLNKLFGDAGNDGITGGADNDSMDGGDGTDNLTGLAGDDIMTGGEDNDIYRGGAGNDDINDTGAATDTDRAFFEGFLSDYVIIGTAQDFTIEGKGFKDHVRGIEALTFDNGTAVATTIATSALPFTIDPKDLVEIKGNGLNNKLTDNDNDNDIFGLGGADTIVASKGDDRVHGGLGKDKLTGGVDNDTFVFDTKPNTKTNVDHITDWNRVEDTIELAHQFFTSLGNGVSTTELRLGTKALDKNDFLVYNKLTGALYYDPDGNGFKAQIQVAVIDNKSLLKAADFDIV